MIHADITINKNKLLNLTLIASILMSFSHGVRGLGVLGVGWLVVSKFT